MTDSDAPDDETDGGTDGEQSAGDGETTERAPEDVTEDDLLTFTAMHLDGMDESDLMEAVDAADASYIGECDAEALFDFVSIVTGAEYGTVEDAMMDLMEASDGESEYGDKEDDEEMDEEEQSAETPESEQSADDADDSDDRAAELESRLDALESELQAVRSGETGIDTPDSGESGDDSGDQRDADADADEGENEQRDMTNPADPPEWAT